MKKIKLVDVLLIVLLSVMGIMILLTIFISMYVQLTYSEVCKDNIKNTDLKLDGFTGLGIEDGFIQCQYYYYENHKKEYYSEIIKHSGMFDFMLR